MNLNGLITHHVEYKVGFNNQNTVTEFFKFFVSWYSTKEGMIFQVEDIMVEFFEECTSIEMAVICDPIKN